jgi:hypothetical protein
VKADALAVDLDGVAIEDARASDDVGDQGSPWGASGEGNYCPEVHRQSTY